MWGQVVVALRDDDTTRRRRADADEDTSIFLSVGVGEPTTLPGRPDRNLPLSLDRRPN